MSNKSMTKDSFIIGFALFAIFFGAGNLIFPPAIGMVSGSNWFVAMLGLIATGIALPILAIIAVSNSDGKFEILTKPISPWFYKAFNMFVMLGIGTAITIPRTAATTYEMGIQPLFPSVPISVTIVMFFVLVFYFANDKNNVMDKIGKFLTPVLLLILLTIIFKGIFAPIAEPIDTGLVNSFSNAFIEAYQTGDLLTGLLFATVFISMIVVRGYEDDLAKKKITLNSSIIAGILLIIVYGGLLYIGATASSLFPQNIEKTALLIGLVDNLLGSFGVTGLATSVALACLSTAIGLTASVADFMAHFTKDKISYRNSVLFVCIIGSFIGIMGVEKIINLAGPMFLAVYPVSILLTFLGLFRKHIPNPGAYRGSVVATLIISLLESLSVIGISRQSINNMLSLIPLGNMGFAWLLPAVIGFVLGAILYKISYNTSRLGIENK